MLNVSNGGLFIKTEHPLPFDAVIILRMQLPDERGKMNIQCRVAWINTVAKSFPSGMVVQLLCQDSEGQKKITVFVDDNREQIKQREIL